MAGNQFGSILEAEVPLDGGKHQIAELPDDADNDAKTYQANGRVERRTGPDKMRANRKEWGRQRDCSERPS